MASTTTRTAATTLDLVINSSIVIIQQSVIAQLQWLEPTCDGADTSSIPIFTSDL